MLRTKIIGYSAENNPIRCHFHGVDSDHRILVIGGIHGDEPSGKIFVDELNNHLAKTETTKTIATIPLLNPDGLRLKTRTNSRGVDINRNFPSSNQIESDQSGRYRGGSALSESETIALVHFCEVYLPTLIITIHQPFGCVDHDGPTEAHLDLLNSLGEIFSLPVKKLGSRPGSMGSYFGEELKIPIITLELAETCEHEYLKTCALRMLECLKILSPNLKL